MTETFEQRYGFAPTIKPYSELTSELSWVARSDVMRHFGFKSITGFNKFVKRHKNFPEPVKHEGVHGRVYYYKEQINSFSLKFFGTEAFTLAHRYEFVGPCRPLIHDDDSECTEQSEPNETATESEVENAYVQSNC